MLIKSAQIPIFVCVGDYFQASQKERQKNSFKSGMMKRKHPLEAILVFSQCRELSSVAMI